MWSKIGNLKGIPGPAGKDGEPGRDSTVPGPAGPPGSPGAIATPDTYLIVGPGRPDQPTTTGGVITGSEPVGAEYRSSDGASVGAWVWRKRPTGWVVVDGDTGWVELSSVTDTADTSQFLFAIRRVNTMVHVRVQVPEGYTGGDKQQITIPVGFRTAAWLKYSVYEGVTVCELRHRNRNTDTNGILNITPSHNFYTLNIVKLSVQATGQGSYPVETAWPTALL